ncbi:MAG: hypothetical protein CMP15_07275 [Rickettsiales bacterium]|nr:hypothetical protein [Rickettsiales bacterium]
MVKLILKLSLIIFLNLLNINLFANDSVVESKSLNDEYADKLRNPEYKYNKLDGKDESLTTSYINSLRSGKWGASDPAWVNLELAQEFFPEATKIGRLEGDVPSAAISSENNLLGYLFITKDITSSLGYSSQVFDIVVGLKLDGRLAGAKVIDHLEPIIGMYTPDGELVMPLFTAQYKDLDIRLPIKINLLRTEGPGDLDGISSATVSAVLFNGAILRAARTLALYKGMRLSDEPVIDIVSYEKALFDHLVSDGSVGRLTLTLDDLKNIGLDKPEITNRTGVADIYRYSAQFAGNTPVAAEQKEVKRGYKDTDRNLVIDLYVAPVITPTIGRNLLGDKWYDIFVAGRDPKETTLVVAGLGRYPLDGEPHIASGNFKRMAIIQDKKRFQLSKEHFRNLGFLHGEDKPFFAEAGIYRIPPEVGIDPVKPWKFELLVESRDKEKNKYFYINYNMKEKYIIQPDGLDVIANNDEPVWYAAWESQRINLSLLFLTLAILSFVLWKVDNIVKRDIVWKSFRYLFLIWVLIWLGFYAGGQITIISLLTWLTAPYHKTSWDVLLSDPLLVSLMLFVIVSFVLWGRGIFCGWLCPFGALQELLAKFAKFMRVKQIQISYRAHQVLWPIKYFLLFGLIGIAFYSTSSLNYATEIEPFKTAISMKFNREWYFVAYAIVLLFIGLFIERFFCRFLCPLGAVMAIGGKLRIFETLKRRKECGSPCKLCSNECPINAIKPSGEIIMDECFYCLDCQSLYYNEHKCPPLVKVRKKNTRSVGPIINIAE